MAAKILRLRKSRRREVMHRVLDLPDLWEVEADVVQRNNPEKARVLRSVAAELRDTLALAARR